MFFNGLDTWPRIWNLVYFGVPLGAPEQSPQTTLRLVHLVVSYDQQTTETMLTSRHLYSVAVSCILH